MLLGARINSVIEILDSILVSNQRSKVIVSKYFLKRKYAGSSDRKYIKDLLYNILRNYFSLVYFCQKNLLLINTKNIVLIMFAKSSINRDNFKGLILGKYPMNLDKKDEEVFCLAYEKKDNIKPILPGWLSLEGIKSFGNDVGYVLSSLQKEARIDLRINTISSDREKIKKLFLKNNINVKETPFSPYGLSVDKRFLSYNFNFIKKGLVEVQDEGSQIVSILAGAKKSMRVLDMCAGKGGKTIALWQEMEQKGELIASDISLDRLKFLKKRINNLDIKNISIRATTDGLENKCDLIMLDVPCSGSGTWRRRPEETIRLDQKIFNNLLGVQEKILDKSVSLLTEKGTIAYVTCSLFKSENENQILKFLDKNKNFELVDLRETWSMKFKRPYKGPGFPWISLRPDREKTDGFFIAVVKKT